MQFYKKIFPVLIIACLAGGLIYIDQKIASLFSPSPYYYGIGTLESPYVYKDQEDRDGLNQIMIDYLDDSESLVEYNVSELGNHYTGKDHNDSFTFFVITSITMSDASETEELLNLYNQNKLHLTVKQGKTLTQRLSNNKSINKQEKAEIVGILGEEWNTTIKQPEVDVIEKAVEDHNGIIAITFKYKITDNYWFSSSLLYEWEDSDSGIVKLPESLNKFGEWS